MATTLEDESGDELLRAALSYLEKSGAAGQSLLVSLPGGRKLGIELDLMPAPSWEGGRERQPMKVG